MKGNSILHSISIMFICIVPVMLANSTTGDDETASYYNETEYISSLNSSEEQGSSMDISSSALEPSVNIELSINRVMKDSKGSKEPHLIIDTGSSESSNNVLHSGTPVIDTLSGSSAVDIKQPLNTSIGSTGHNVENITSTTLTHQDKFIENASESTTTTTENTTILMNDNIHSESFGGEVSEDSNIQKNITEGNNEEIPSFSEWAQKRLEEVEKNEQVNSTLKGQTINGKGSSAKLRWKNYASLDCGAKVIAANPESISPGAILSPSNDEYKLNTCTTRIWFVVELCEAIQTKKIDLANYELFSSSPKDFTVSVSDRYPTREWSIIGKFTAKDERDLQSFDMDTNIFGKYIKVDIKSHYGSEHYCPISLFRAFGTSVFEVLQKEDPAHVNRVDDDDDSNDEDEHITILNKENLEHQKNLFSSATDAVISIVKRAAQVLGNKVNNQSMQEKIPINYSSISNICSTPSYMIYCSNCSEEVFGQIYELISCKSFYIRKLVEIPLIYRVLTNSVVCKKFSTDFETYLNLENNSNSYVDYIMSAFPFKYIGAMCNEISILENNSVLNISHQFSNTTENITNGEIFSLKIEDPHINQIEKLVTKSEIQNGMDIHDLPYLNNTDKYTFEESNIEHITFLSQIKPTRALTTDMKLSKTYTNLNHSQSSEKDNSFEETSTETVGLYSSTNFIDATTEIEIGSEGIYVLDDHLEHFISELNGDYTPNTLISSTGGTNSPHVQKESIFLRLSNRIKVLERNMSLSSQYLEELSRRYKKQVEEMQNLLEKTIITLREESRKKDARNKQLEDRLDSLTAVMESMITERHTWFITICWLIFSMCFFSSVYIFCRKYSPYFNFTTNTKETTKILCCKYIDVIAHNSLEKNIRRPSDEALKIVHCSAIHNDDEKGKTNQRKRKKKYMLRRSNSISNIKDNKYTCTQSDPKNADWVENNQVIEDIPFVLDDSDHSTLEAYRVENEMMKVESPNYIDTSLSNISSSPDVENGVNIFEKLRIEESSEKTSQNISNNISSRKEPIKRERKSLKKLFKKVF